MNQLSDLMRKAKEVQEKMTSMRHQLEMMDITGQSGGGLVKITCDGNGRSRRITIDPSLMALDERETLEDLIVAAVNDAQDKASSEAKKVMHDIAGPLPGL